MNTKCKLVLSWSWHIFTNRRQMFVTKICLVSSSSHISIFWFLVDGYQKTIKFVEFSKKSISCLTFFEVTMEDVHFNSWYFGLFVAIYLKPKEENMRWTGHLIRDSMFKVQQLPMILNEQKLLKLTQ